MLIGYNFPRCWVQKVGGHRLVAIYGRYGQPGTDVRVPPGVYRLDPLPDWGQAPGRVSFFGEPLFPEGSMDGEQVWHLCRAIEEIRSGRQTVNVGPALDVLEAALDAAIREGLRVQANP